jgi:broad specificity phosphatase PhoE
MAKLILIPSAQTDWRAEGRLAGDTDLPLNEIGHRMAVAMGRDIATLAPTLIRAGAEQSARQTASLIGHEVNQRVRTIKDLREMRLGLWQGLPIQDLEERFGKVYRQWRTDPLSIEPPEGETVANCAARLAAAIRKLTKKRETETLAIVVGQYAFAILRCHLLDDSYKHFWEYVDNEQTIQVVEIPTAAPSPPKGLPPESNAA